VCVEGRKYQPQPCWALQEPHEVKEEQAVMHNTQQATEEQEVRSESRSER
jgi:hypothetical protein